MNFFHRFAGYGFRKLRIRIFLLAVLILPETVGGWHCVSEHVTPLVLAVDSSDIGTITYRDYVRDGRTIHAILTQGTGTGSLYVPESVNDVRGVMPSGSVYELIDINGYKSILERYDYLPLSLAVHAGKDTVLTVEGTDRDSMTEFVKEVSASWSSTK